MAERRWAEHVVERLKSLRRGNGNDAVLGVDFGEGRAVASFPDMAAAFPSGDLTFFECQANLVEGIAPDRLTAAAYAAAVVDEVVDIGYDVVGVLGRCGGASLACATARALVAAGSFQPFVVVFCPEVVDDDVAFTQFEHAMGGLVSALGEREVVRAREDCYAAMRERGEELDFAVITRLMYETYEPLAHRAMTGIGAPADFGAHLAERFAVFLSYLRCAAEAPIALPDDWEVSRVYCREHVARGTEHGLPALRLDIGHDELMSNPMAADLVHRAHMA